MFRVTKNRDLYEESAAGLPKEVMVEWLIITNNSSYLGNINKQELRGLDQALLRGNSHSLFDTAFLYGDFTAIKILVEAGVNIPNDDVSLKRFLKELFTKYGDIHKCDSDINSYDKSTENLIKIYHYLREHIVKGNSIWTDKSIMNTLLAESASGEETMPLEALLKLGLFDNINTTDSTGKTALYYLQAKKPNSSLIDELKKLGAVFSAADHLAFQQEKLANDLIQGIKNRDRELINISLKKIEADKLALTQSLFESCLKTAIAEIDIDTVQFLLRTHQGQQIGLSHFGTTEAAMAYTMATVHHNKTSETVLFKNILSSYAHRIGVSGVIRGEYGGESKTYALEGMVHIFGVRTLREVLAGYSEKNSAFKPIYDAVSFLANVNDIAPDVASASSLMFRYYSEGNSMLFTPGWIDHALGIGVKYDSKSNKTYVSVSNRGDGSLDACLTEEAKKNLKDLPNNTTGTVVYELSDKLDQSFFARMNVYTSNLSEGTFPNQQKFTEELNRQLKDAKPVAILPALKQARGTCAYINIKRTVEGLLFIDALRNGKLPDKNTMDEVYNQYKQFSFYDKEQAVRGLIEYAKSCNQSSHPEKIEINALNKFIVAIIIEHHSNKYNEIELELAKELFKILPNELKEKISRIEPRLSDAKTEEQRKKKTANITMFSEQRHRVRDIKITGSLDELDKYAAVIKRLCNYFFHHNITSKEVESIRVEGGKMTISTGGEDTKIKYKIRDDIFINELGAKIENISGQFKFHVNNPDELKLPALESQHPSRGGRNS